jgi:ribosomal protein L14
MIQMRSTSRTTRALSPSRWIAWWFKRVGDIIKVSIKGAPRGAQKKARYRQVRAPSRRLKIAFDANAAVLLNHDRHSHSVRRTSASETSPPPRL